MRMKRRVEISTPLGDALKFHRQSGREALGQVHAFELELLDASNPIDARALPGKSAAASMRTQTGRRYLGGIALALAPGSRRYFEKGELMPVIEGSTFADTYWQRAQGPDASNR
ncbi:hypothetical protein QMO14_00100 [Variovorax sp. CAN2819]|uniref:hypothetical protein n=1 Tax=Variovorax sp. CAN15 TaxID=3046727 RepID=UPI00264792F8|nr:hypothetical protein [Variovorax sp. CAN15]MDN6881985.1 hypothetical protein [Variovorax sp. CAN15]